MKLYELLTDNKPCLLSTLTPSQKSLKALTLIQMKRTYEMMSLVEIEAHFLAGLPFPGTPEPEEDISLEPQMDMTLRPRSPPSPEIELVFTDQPAPLPVSVPSRVPAQLPERAPHPLMEIPAPGFFQPRVPTRPPPLSLEYGRVFEQKPPESWEIQWFGLETTQLRPINVPAEVPQPVRDLPMHPELERPRENIVAPQPRVVDVVAELVTFERMLVEISSMIELLEEDCIRFR